MELSVSDSGLSPVGFMASKKNMDISLTTHEAQRRRDRAWWKSRTPEERLHALEQLRIQSGKFLYEYPARLRRIVTVTRKPEH